ncbi:MAG: hypothetical protein Satyrvirus6_12 [Satyrvirus sp.]|uniref:Uncharacterized protein n=1 Tax=Satyrvirus sp. TaxID=2487771 RepID=A0A3G5ADC9_9VIRU|nr:MAG: hypothetical protein Satyrvirus6_12 [Satyrvirus sp.]
MQTEYSELICNFIISFVSIISIIAIFVVPPFFIGPIIMKEKWSENTTTKNIVCWLVGLISMVGSILLCLFFGFFLHKISNCLCKNRTEDEIII